MNSAIGKIRKVIMIFLLLFWILPVVLGQDNVSNKEKKLMGGFLFVVTNRVIDTLPEGDVTYTNKVDTSGQLKYLITEGTYKNYRTSGYPDLQTLLGQPALYKDWAVWVHGDGQTFEISMKRAQEIQSIHKVNLIVFSWPSMEPGKGPIGNFKNSRYNALMTAPFLHEFLHEVALYRDTGFNRIQSGNLSIFFHSLGCYLLKETVGMGYLDDLPEGSFDNLILNAAATSSEGHAGWVERLKFQKRLYIAFNDGDINLEGLRVLSSEGYQLGERPFPPLAKNAIYLDFSESVGSRFPTGASHSYYFDLMTEISENIRETYTILLEGYPLRFSDPERFRPTQEGNVFQVLF